MNDLQQQEYRRLVRAVQDAADILGRCSGPCTTDDLPVMYINADNVMERCNELLLKIRAHLKRKG